MNAATKQIESLRQQIAQLQQQLATLQPSAPSHDTPAAHELEALRNANEFRRAIIDNVAEGICACYVIEEFPYVKFSEWNRRMCEITGYSMEEINRLGWYQTVYPDPELSRQAAERMERMSAGDHLVAEEWEITRKDGQPRVVAISTAFIETEEGIPAVAAMMQDVTQRKAAERALQESQRENELLLDTIPDMLLRVDRHGTYLSHKPPRGFQPWRAADGVLGTNIRDSVPPGVAEYALNLVEEAIATDVPQQMEVCLETDHGEVFRDVRIVPSKHEQALIIIRDITQRRAAEIQRDEYVRLTEAIHRVQSQYISERSPGEVHHEILAELIALTKCDVGFVGQVTVTNDGRYRLQTLADSGPGWDAISHHFFGVAKPLEIDLGDSDTLFGQVVLSRETVFGSSLEESERDSDPTNRQPMPNSFMGVPLMYDGQLIGLVGVAKRDEQFEQAIVEYVQPFLSTCASLMAAQRHHAQQQATEQRLSQQEVQLAHITRLKTLGEMVAAMAHEMTQPLSAISNYAAAAATQVAPESTPDLAQWLARISEQSARGGKIIERLRRFSERGKPRLETTSLEQIVSDAISLLEFHLRRRGAEVSVSHTGRPFPLNVDPIQIQQVLVNLVSNSADAMDLVADSRKLVQIELTYESDTAIISVADDGAGIPPDLIEQVFEPFVTTKQDGIGMGLAICRSIIEAHGGKIWPTTNPSGGTTFHFRLPKERTPSP